MKKEDLEFSIEEVKMIAKVQRDMDSGEQPFVVFQDERLPVHPDCMKDLGLESGQTVNPIIQLKILEWMLAQLKAKQAIHEAQTEK